MTATLTPLRWLSPFLNSWYLGLEEGRTRKPGVVTADNPRTGAYKMLVESGHDLHELHALMAPRLFLVSGGAQRGDWRPVSLLLGACPQALGQSQRRP